VISDTSASITTKKPNVPQPEYTNVTASITPNHATGVIDRIETSVTVVKNAPSVDIVKINTSASVVENAPEVEAKVNEPTATLTEIVTVAEWRNDMSQWKTGDTWPPLEVTLKKDGVPIDLTTASSVAFHSAPSTTGSTPSQIKINAPMQITDPVNGVCQYLWQPDDLNDVGKFNSEYEITWSDGGIQTVPAVGYLEYNVAAQLDVPVQ
jgi:hypothetical protein